MRTYLIQLVLSRCASQAGSWFLRTEWPPGTSRTRGASDQNIDPMINRHYFATQLPYLVRLELTSMEQVFRSNMYMMLLRPQHEAQLACCFQSFQPHLVAFLGVLGDGFAQLSWICSLLSHDLSISFWSGDDSWSLNVKCCPRYSQVALFF